MKISEVLLKEVCKIGQGKECCRYLTCGPDGFSCVKHNFVMKLFLDKRVRDNAMIAQGDNCEGLTGAEVFRVR